MGIFGKNERDPETGLRKSDRWFIRGAYLSGDDQAAQARKAEAMQALLGARELAARQKLFDSLKGAPRIGANGEAAAPRGLPSLREAAPEVLDYIGAGGDARQVIDVLDKSGPSIQTANEWGYDARDAKNAGRHFPKSPEGGGWEPLFDRNGQPRGWTNGAGVVQGLAEREGATAAARAKAEAPYEFETFTDPSGKPTIASRSTLAGGMVSGQSPDESAYAKGVGETAAKRFQELQGAVDADTKMAPLFDRMEELLDGGELVTGAFAQPRLNFERGLALAGDDSAKRRVASTEEWQNLTNRQVLPLIKQLGASTAISDADREFTQKIVAGEISLNEETMRRVVKIGRQAMGANRKSLEGFQAPGRQPSSRPQPRTQGRGYRVLGVE